MSATAAAPAPAPIPQSAPRTPQQTVAAQARKVGGPSMDEDVPAVLNRLQILAVVVCVAFAALSGTFLTLSWHADGAAADNTEQLVRVQGIKTSLLRADALATNAFLAGGIEAPEQRAQYDAAIADVTTQIADAAEAQSADREALAALNTAVNAYTATSTQARDNNRQGFPIASEYLRESSSNLRATALPIVDNLVAANDQRARDEMGSQHTFGVLLPGVVVLVVLVLVNRELRRRFKRTYNTGIAGAFLIVGVLTFIATITVHHRNNANDDLLSGSYFQAVHEAQARTAGNDAASNASLDLLAQGGTTSFADAFTAASDVVKANDSSDTDYLWDNYLAQHKQVVALAAKGDYDGAVNFAISVNGPTAALDDFDKAAKGAVTQSAAQTTDSLRSGDSFAFGLAMATFLLGLVAAGLSVRGIGARRREYS